MVEENKVVNDDPTIVESDGINQDSSIVDKGTSVGLMSNNKTLVIMVCSVFGAIIFYLFFFKKSNKEDVLSDANLLVRDNQTTNPNRPSYSDLDTALDNTTKQTNDYLFDEKPVDLVPDIPDSKLDMQIQIPELSHNTKQQIEKDLSESLLENNIADGKNYFTKEQVDSLINEKLQNFESTLKSMQSESSRLAEELKKRDEEAAAEKKKDNRITSNLFSDSKNKNEVSPNKAAVNPFASDSGLDKDKEDNEEKKQEDLLKMAQRNRVMVERRAAPMFKMQGGGGGSSAMDQESIIIMDKNLLTGVKETQQNVVATKTSDLTRVILQGKIIDAVLETAIDTDIAAQVRAVVTRDVYAEYGKNVLIPKGSRVVGTFQSQVTTGVARLGIVWNRIIRVDGLSLNIAANTTDELGRGGVAGDLDNKYFQTLRNAFLSSMLTIATAHLVEKVTDSSGLTVVKDKDGAITDVGGSATSFAIRDATQDFMDEAKDIVDNMKEEKPTIRIAQGTKIIIMVNQDLNLPVYKK